MRVGVYGYRPRFPYHEVTLLIHQTDMYMYMQKIFLCADKGDNMVLISFKPTYFLKKYTKH